jgi:hypothetical protein
VSTAQPLSSDDPVDASAVLRSTQVIVAALASGVTLFAAVAAVLGPLGDPPAPVALGLDGIALAAAVVTLTTLPVAFFLPTRLVEEARDRPVPQRLQAFRTSRILGAALCEGPALFWCVAMLLAGNRWFLAPIALLVALLLLHLPSGEGFENATGTRARRG